METHDTQDPRALEARIAEAQRRLDEQVAAVRAVDAELETLATERRSNVLLETACSALEELDTLGRAADFWGAGAGTAPAERLRTVRARVEGFRKSLEALEDRRRERFEAVEAQQEVVWFLEDELDEVRYQEEQRRYEWVIERELDGVPWRTAVMPWARGGEDDRRARRSLAIAVVLSLVLTGLVGAIEVPAPEPFEIVDVPDRLVRLIREQRSIPPAPVRSEPVVPKETTPPRETVPELADTVVPTPAPEEGAGSTGLLAFRERLADATPGQAVSRLGAQARIRESGAAAQGRPERSMVTSQAAGSSGGIRLSSLSRGVGGAGGDSLGGVDVARAQSRIGGTGNGTDRPRAGGPSAGRTDEEIQIVFDRHKAALYRLYNRALRHDPTLKGQMVLRFTIEPDGSVSRCALRSTDMNAPELSEQVVARVRTFDFGAKEGIPAVTILYPIDFLPAT